MTANASLDLAAALGIRGGIVCTVGAGGKKSLQYALARAIGGRVGVTATVTTYHFPRSLQAEVLIDDEDSLRQQLARPGAPGVYAYACPSTKGGRLDGLAPATIAAIHTGGAFDLTLVKADGARMRGIKAPKVSEPVLPENPACVLAIVSARVIGEPLNAAVAHRPELLADVVGAALESIITPEHVGRLLASERGALQGSAGLRVVPVINQVDDEARLQQARAAAKVALAQTARFDRVVLTCLHGDNQRVEVVSRAAADGG